MATLTQRMERNIVYAVTQVGTPRDVVARELDLPESAIKKIIGKYLRSFGEYRISSEELSRIIDEKMKEKDIDPRELARQTSYKERSIREILAGKVRPSNKRLERISIALELDLSPYIVRKTYED